MTSVSDDNFVFRRRKRRSSPPLNVTRKFFDRQLALHVRANVCHLIEQRKFYSAITPSCTLFNVNKPPSLLRRFTPDGRHMIAFSFQPGLVEIYEYTSVAQINKFGERYAESYPDINNFNRMDDKFIEQARSTVFNLLFKLKATLRLPPDPFDMVDSSESQTQSSQSSINTTGGGTVQETANLFREFSIFTNDNRYLILAGSQPTPDESLRASDVFRNNETTRVPLSTNLEDFELFCIDIEKGICTDAKKFKMDKINMRHNEGVSLHNRILAVLSIFHQTIHLYHLTDDGHFIEMQRIGQFLNENDALNWHRYCLDHEKIYESSATKDHSYSSLFDTFNAPLKQQLLSSLYKLTHQNDNHEAWTAEKRVNACRKFYKRFSVFERMKIYRMRLLDEENIFIRFVDQDLLTRHVQEDDDVSFFVFYNIPKNKILAAYENNDPVCLNIFEKFVDCFRYGMPPGEKFLKLNDKEPLSPAMNNIGRKFNLQSLSSQNDKSTFLFYDRFSSTISYSLHANKQYNEFKKSLEEKLRGRIGDLCKCILNQLPHFEQSFSSSPYFDPELFICDPRRLSAYDRPKSYDDLPVRVRDPKTGALRFQLKCMSYRSSNSQREPNKNLAIYIFHPYEPFAISMQRTESFFVLCQALQARECGATMMKQNGADQQKLLPLSQCKKVFILRDYSQGLTVKFFAKLPTELQGYVDANYFESFVNELNRIYAAAERTGLESVFETLAGCLTCYLANLCLRTQYEKYLKQIAKYLKEENEKIFLPAGIFVTDPIERGLRIIEISFVDEPASNVVKNAPAPTPLAPVH